MLSVAEANYVLSYLKGTPLLVAQLMYGAGLRLKDALRLRVQDVDFGRMEITVRHGKGGKDKMTLLPKASVEALRTQIESSRLLHQKALEDGACFVHLPHALARKYPNVGKELAWQYIFASTQLSKDPRTGNVGRHHINQRGIQSAVKHAVRQALTKMPAATLFGIVLRHICWRADTISEPFKSCWVMLMSIQQ